MLLFVKTLWQICRLQKGPQDISHSNRLLTLLIVINYAVTLVFIGRTQGLSNAVWMAAISLAIPLGIIYFVLRLKQLQARFTQTVVALYATNILLSFITVVVLFFTVTLISAGLSLPGQTVGGIVIIAMGVWILLVGGHVLRHALGSPLWVGLLMMISMELLSGLCLNAMMGGS